MSVPVGVQFGQTPGEIVHRGQLRIPIGQTLGLLGGDVTIKGGRLTASSGRIEVGSVAAGAIALNPFTFAASYNNAASFGNIHLGQAAILSATGNGGNIDIQATDLNILGEFVTYDEAGEVETIVSSGINNQVRAGANGQGGDLSIAAQQIRIANGGEIRVATRGDGNAGNIHGKAGEIYSQAQSVEVAGFSPLLQQNFVQGNVFNLDEGYTSSIYSLSETEAPAGSVEIRTNRLLVRDLGIISVSNIGSGDAGIIRIQADSVQLDNQGQITAQVKEGF